MLAGLSRWRTRGLQSAVLVLRRSKSREHLTIHHSLACVSPWLEGSLPSLAVSGFGAEPAPLADLCVTIARCPVGTIATLGVIFTHPSPAPLNSSSRVAANS